MSGCIEIEANEWFGKFKPLPVKDGLSLLLDTGCYIDNYLVARHSEHFTDFLETALNFPDHIWSYFEVDDPEELEDDTIHSGYDRKADAWIVTLNPVLDNLYYEIWFNGED